ncbi:MAG: PAS domain S-box protein [Desulfobacula sp.]|jgi:PAS domain-containing protein|uniref:PAS domain S-box protein n=1 Tax=Desulfobacula sp. TaxID=2593537 RepID=UPI001D3D6D70|nr:PAS domain S-box protein [Desulfobacula sp.]MBT3487457.1 PAS domain S-box protein [Desulfobacula sp.]MBT3807577.1 PAS domain S-box protein [Desulfobacula sp.]MBT4027301.1 PAS domain S-box protein [Desulfobacula sp.]MBT4201138.1 PAS domain S-box protein [Desulfobacula sp.]
MTKKPTYENLEHRTRESEPDESERKMIDNALQDSEEKYRLLFDGSNDGIVLHDIDGRILDVNKKIQH